MLRNLSLKAVAIAVVLALGGCASAPRQINNVCAVFEQRDGWFDNWYVAAKRTERQYGVPVPILMATIRKESGFKSRVRPPRTKLLGFIPWKRQSSAYGFSQALDGTWAQYRRETGRFGASRNNFGDAVDFVGWYHSKSNQVNGIALNDAYHLYLAYYFGHTSFSRGDWKTNASMQRVARATAKMASDYAAQMRACNP
ncbi:MAG: hypothetical protein ACRECY_19385 [Phyllobacterium sp.]